jgi:hypothetical protein
LNKVVDVRGDRISLCNQRIFESLRFVAMVTSLIFALPFYFAQPRQPYAFVSTALVFGVFFLVIFLLTTIEDLDEPYTGIWKISNKPWLRLHVEITESIAELESLPEMAEESLSIQKNARPKKTRKASK